MSQESGLAHESEKLKSNVGSMNWVASDEERPNQHKEPQKYCCVTPGGYQTTMNAQAVSFEEASNYIAIHLGLVM